MDFDFGIGPVFEKIAPNYYSADAIRFRKYWSQRFELVADVASVLSVQQFIARGRLFATSFKLRAGASRLEPFFLPFTAFVEKPGLIHLVLDAGFFQGKRVFNALDQSVRLTREWLENVDAASLENAIGPQAFSELTKGGTTTAITATVEMPPMWLADP